MYEGDDLNYEDEEETPPEEASNRTFLIAAGILGGIVLLSIACLAVYALVIMPRQKATQQGDQNALATQNAQIQGALTQTQVAASLSQTPQATETLFPTDTPVVAQPSATNIVEAQPTLTSNPATATVGAGLTMVAASTSTIIPTSTSLPVSGFADEVGLPGLVIAAMVLVAVIFLARRLRATPTR